MRNPRATAPDARLRFAPDALGLKEFTRDFFLRDTEVVARELLGSWFARCFEGSWYGARIVETEAYLGIADRAAHSWGGRRTPRVEPMYKEGGHLYVFLVYGMYNCANVVTREHGRPEAVLLRAADACPNAPAKLLSGPGKFCAALGISVAQSGLDLLNAGEVRLFRGDTPSPSIGTSRRIGVDYAGDAMQWPLRFFDTKSKAVSGPARLR